MLLEVSRLCKRLASWQAVSVALHGVQAEAAAVRALRIYVCAIAAIWQAGRLCLSRCTGRRLKFLLFVRRQLAHSPLLRCASEAAAAQAVALLRRLGSWQARPAPPRLLVVINPQSGRGR